MMRWVVVAGVLGLACGAAIERACAPPPAPRVEYRDRVVERVIERQAETVHHVEAPTRVVTRWLAPACSSSSAPARPAPPGPPTIAQLEGQVLVERVEERGPVTDDRRTETARAATIDAASEVKVTPPAPRPGWALSAGLQLTPELVPALQIGRRLVGPFWLELQLRQRLALEPPAAAALLRVEF